MSSPIERFHRGEAVERREPEEALGDCVNAITSGDVAEMRGSMQRLLVLTLGYDHDIAQDVAAHLMGDVPFSSPSEFGVRVIKEAAPSKYKRGELLLKLTAFIVTAPDASISSETGMKWSREAVQVAGVLIRTAAPRFDAYECQQFALDRYIAILQDYLRDAVDRMAQSETADEYQEWFTIATIISELQADVIELCTDQDEDDLEQTLYTRGASLV